MKKIIAIVLAVSSLFFLTATKTLADWSAGVSVSVGLEIIAGSVTTEEESRTDYKVPLN